MLVLFASFKAAEARLENQGLMHSGLLYDWSRDFDHSRRRMFRPTACSAMALLILSSALAPSSAFVHSANPLNSFTPHCPMSAMAKSPKILERGFRIRCAGTTISMTDDAGPEVASRRAVLSKAAALAAGLVSVVFSPGDAAPSLASEGSWAPALCCTIPRRR